jgi:hypothetical protein
MLQSYGDASRRKHFTARRGWVTERATRCRQAEKADTENLLRIPSVRTIARLMTVGRAGSRALRIVCQRDHEQ